ncbi:MAG TPA: sugar transferase [Euzebya sp.]|nr:sugar transferase [Euzebya sp.]
MTEREMVLQGYGASVMPSHQPQVMDANPMLVTSAGPGTGWYLRYGKRAVDTVLALIALLLLTPLMAMVAFAVLTSVGSPIFFSQTRIGREGRPFDVYKFRTMHTDRRTTQDRRSSNRQAVGQDRRRTHKSAEDPRLTPTGRVLRRLSLDELPQLINVLRGQMSLVGPRPELPSIIERHYEDWHHRRHAVRPGITGLWQITERGNGMMHEHVDVDLDYIDQVGPLTDLKILLLTMPAALGSRRGY